MVDIDEHGDMHLPVDAPEVVHHLLGGHWVQGGHRLVCQNDLGILSQSPGQGHPLLLSAGELVRPDKGLVQNPHLVQRLQGLHLLLFREDAEGSPPPG